MVATIPADRAKVGEAGPACQFPSAPCGNEDGAAGWRAILKLSILTRARRAAPDPASALAQCQCGSMATWQGARRQLSTVDRWIVSAHNRRHERRGQMR